MFRRSTHCAQAPAGSRRQMARQRPNVAAAASPRSTIWPAPGSDRKCRPAPRLAQSAGAAAVPSSYLRFGWWWLVKSKHGLDPAGVPTLTLTPSTMICPILVTTCEAGSKPCQQYPSLLCTDDLKPGRGLSDAGKGQR